MSQYETYDVTSQTYDATRVPVGIDAILACLARSDVGLGEQTLLDAGCGTGNYLHALRPYLGKVYGMDFSDGMLELVREKLGGDVELTCGSILDLPYAEQTFDSIVCNQVVHHLEKGPSPADDPAAWSASEYPNTTRFIHEAYRVLRRGGGFVLNITSHQQLRDGFWWADLIPTATERLRCRLPDLEQLEQILTDAGFAVESVSADLDGVLQGASYLDPEGPLSEAWRAGDSTWSLATETELADARQRVKQMIEAGTMQAYLDRRESIRRTCGQTMFVCGRKSLASD